MSINFASLKQFYKHLKVNVLIHIQELRYNFKNLKKKKKNSPALYRIPQADPWQSSYSI